MAEALLRASPVVCVVPRAVSRCERRGVTSTACRRSTSRPKTISTWTTCCDTARSSSSWRAPRRWSHATCSTGGSASAAAADLPPSRRDPACHRARRRADRGIRTSKGSRRGSTIASASSPAAAAPPFRASRRCGRHSTGVTSSSRIPSAPSCGAFRSWREASRSTLPPRSRRTQELADGDIVECVANLVAKSLISVDFSGAVTGYRLLETTRAYAAEKLAESGEVERFRRRHAEYYRDLFQRADTEWRAQPTGEWLATYGPQLDDLRAALDWAFAPEGDAALGVALTIAAVPLWFQLSLLGECRARVERALSTLSAMADRDAPCELQLQAALGWSLMYTTGPARETGAAWATALQLAETTRGHRLSAARLVGTLGCSHQQRRVSPGPPTRGEVAAVATKASDPSDALIGERIARNHAPLPRRADTGTWPPRTHARTLCRPAEQVGHRPLRFDQRVAARMTLARVLWLQGFADQAMGTVQRAVDDALSIQHGLSLCNLLGSAACPLAIANGDLAAADRYAAMLTPSRRAPRRRRVADVWSLPQGHACSSSATSSTSVCRCSAPPSPSSALRGSSSTTRRFSPRWRKVSPAPARRSRPLAVLDEALARSDKAEERWILAELLRLKGELVLLQRSAERRRDRGRLLPAVAGVGTPPGRARVGAAEHDEPGAAWHRQRKTSQARTLLAAVYRRFTEGFDTTDVVSAKTLLASFR